MENDKPESGSIDIDIRPHLERIGGAMVPVVILEMSVRGDNERRIKAHFSPATARSLAVALIDAANLGTYDAVLHAFLLGMVGGDAVAAMDLLTKYRMYFKAVSNPEMVQARMGLTEAIERAVKKIEGDGQPK